MNWQKILGVLWAVPLAFSGALAFLSFIALCDSPSGCVNSTRDALIIYAVRLAPFIFAAGILGAFLPKNNTTRTVLVLLPLIPLAAFIYVYFNYQI